MKAREIRPELIYSMKLKVLHILSKYHFMVMEIFRFRTLTNNHIKKLAMMLLYHYIKCLSLLIKANKSNQHKIEH